jgi:predicted cobalt transporter CbtA
MVRDLLIRGMIAGAVAGLLAFGIAKVYGEPQVDHAIAFEEQHSAADAPSPAPATAHHHDDAGAAAHNHGGEDALVSREVQSTAGLLTAVVVYGAALGGLFALAFAFLYGRVGDIGPRTLALLLAAAAFAALYYVPSLKYPANPPAVGDGATIGLRTGLFFLMIAISLGALVFAVTFAKRLAGKMSSLNAALAGAGVFLVIIAIAQLLLPDINEVPADFPASVLWKFRMASLFMQAMLWGALGLLFGILAERALRDRRTTG